MVALLGPKDIVQSVVLQELDVRSIGTQAVLGEDELEVRVVLAEFNDKPFGGMAFTIIFVSNIVFHDRFRHQRNHDTHIWVNDGGDQHLMRIRDRPVEVNSFANILHSEW